VVFHHRRVEKRLNPWSERPPGQGGDVNVQVEEEPLPPYGANTELSNQV
jgi:hypothetical protein